MFSCFILIVFLFFTGALQETKDCSENGSIGQWLVVGGWEARNWSHHVALCKLDKPIPVDCAGSLITFDWILTAAHCVVDYVKNPRDLKVKLGARTLRPNSCQRNLFGEQLRGVSEVHIHPNFQNPLVHSNDVALLKLDQSACEQEWIQPIRMQHQSPPILPSDKCYVMGWGMTEADLRSDRLLETRVRVRSHRSCIERYGLDKIDFSMFCAGELDRTVSPNTCSGDSGGAFACRDGSEWFLAGMVSFGDYCLMPRSLGVYANMDRLQGFVDRTIEPDSRIVDLRIVTSLSCPPHFILLHQNLNLDSEQPKFICYKRQKSPARPILEITVEESNNCPPRFEKVDGNLRENGEASLCYRKSGNNPMSDPTMDSKFRDFMLDMGLLEDEEGASESSDPKSPISELMVIPRLAKFAGERRSPDLEIVLSPIVRSAESTIFLAIRRDPL